MSSSNCGSAFGDEGGRERGRDSTPLWAGASGLYGQVLVVVGDSGLWPAVCFPISRSREMVNQLIRAGNSLFGWLIVNGQRASNTIRAAAGRLKCVTKKTLLFRINAAHKARQPVRPRFWSIWFHCLPFGRSTRLVRKALTALHIQFHLLSVHSAQYLVLRVI